MRGMNVFTDLSLGCVIKATLGLHQVRKQFNRKSVYNAISSLG